MERYLEQLVSIAAPPAGVRNNDVEWDALESEMGVVYPQSFKQFVGIYGSSKWMGRKGPVYGNGHPDSSSNWSTDNYRSAIQFMFEQMKASIPDHEDQSKYRFYPEDEGLLPFLFGDDGDFYLWSMEGEPDEWPIMAWYLDSTHRFEGYSISRLLLEWLQNRQPVSDWLGDVRAIRNREPELPMVMVN